MKTPHSYNQCQKLIERLEAFIDGELSPEEAQKLRKQIDECPNCCQQYLQEKNFRELLKQLKNQTLSVELKDLKAQILEKIRQCE